ncbi:MAG: AAA domain-containing protein [Cyclobacteriaceae bacterium]|nr:AAA domain-containing protein [Cyclobacteriaceae bacterium]
MNQLLKSYSKRLTNLTGKNRSVLLLKLNSSHYADIHKFSFLNGKPSFSIIESLILGKKVIICPEMDSRDQDVNLISRILRKIQRADNFIFEEQGSRDLHIGWPFLRGKLADGTPVRCALAYFPVELKLNKNKWEIIPRTDTGATLNRSFLLAYGHYNQVKIPDELLETNLDDFDNDITVFRTSLYQLFRDSGVEFNFNRDNFQDELTPFQEFGKKDFEENHKYGELKLFPEAVLGIFPQTGSHLSPDYDVLLGSNRFRDLDEFFKERSNIEERSGNSPYFFLGQVSEEKTFTPFKIDAFQENAIKAVKKGYSLVVQGPPGTGKSQLICNLVSDFMARGKKVLVVCQKRAALDVVYDRLKEKFLADFIGLVHDYRNDRKEIFEKIARQIRVIPEYQHQNNNLDQIPLERRFLQVSRQIDRIVEELEEYKSALFDETECGISAKELYLTSDISLPIVNLRQYYRNFSFEHLPDFLNTIQDYVEYAKQFKRSDYPLLERKPFKGYGISEQKKMEDILHEIPVFHESIQTKLNQIFNRTFSLEDCENLLALRHKVVEMLNILKDEKTYACFHFMAEYSDQETNPLWLSNTERVIMECYKGEGPEISLPADQLGKFQEVLQRSIEARKGLLKLVRWKLLSEDKYYIKRVLVANGLKVNKEGFRSLVERIDNRLNIEHNLSKLKEKKWISDIPSSYEKLNFQNWFHTQKIAIKAKAIFNSLRPIKDHINLAFLHLDELSDILNKFFSVVNDIPERRSIWELYFSRNQITNILNNPSNANNFLKILKRDFEALCDFDEIQDKLTSYEKEVLDLTIGEAPSDQVEEILNFFENSLKIAWIDHIEAKFPVLRSVSSMKFRKKEAELQNLVKEKLDISNEILLLKTREQTYESIEYNRLKNRVTYRDLDHQVNKKRRVWPLRKLIDQFNHELFNLVPCWLGSPESVSAIFPMEPIFDIVIFDEASQCFVEQGIPAMYRGRQIVVAGDDKQLRPNDLYQIRYEEDIDEDPALEISSVLDLARRYLMEVQLRGHYRSKTLDLIDFSNQKFYHGNLHLLPDRKMANSKTPAINYIKVDGIWEKNHNHIEAEKVVSITTQLLTEQPDKSIGILTFNARQQEHIMDLIDEKAIRSKITFPASLFVKNIENVQGDERDIIIFSIGYGPDPSGRMVMQFGSLNAEFGENRLNVAVTRAREKIIIVSSISPPQLKVADSKNSGPKLLREYLEYALDVSEGRYTPTPNQSVAKSAHWFLKAKIIQWAQQQKGFEIIEELPFADLTIKEDQDYLGLIRTDDDLYYSAASVKDAHVYTPFVLTKKKWPFYSISSREYWNDKNALFERLNTYIINQLPVRK